MIGSRAIIFAGIVIIGAGIIFHLQGQSVIGPETSFMYSNPNWVSYGVQIAIVGSIIFVIGLGLYFKRLRV